MIELREVLVVAIVITEVKSKDANYMMISTQLKVKRKKFQSIKLNVLPAFIGNRKSKCINAKCQSIRSQFHLWKYQKWKKVVENQKKWAKRLLVFDLQLKWHREFQWYRFKIRNRNRGQDRDLKRTRKGNQSNHSYNQQ